MPFPRHKPLIESLPSQLETLADRIANAIDKGRGIQLSPSELDWFAVCGGMKAVADAATNEIVQRARRRLTARGADLSFLDTFSPPEKAASERKPSPSPTPTRSEVEEPDIGPAPPFSPATLATRWGVSTSVIYSRMKSGSLPHFRLGSLYRIRNADVLEYERTHDARGRIIPDAT